VPDMLDRIDAVINGLCPCGAEPAPGSAYCGDDCTPTHVSIHTDQRETGDLATPMRWRPDLVSAVDDSARILINEFRRGGYNARVYEYTDGGQVHLRLDDGNRFVGVDVDNAGPSTNDWRDTWTRLARELGNGQHIEADADPWVDVMPLRQQHPEPWERRCLHCGERTEPYRSMRELWSNRAQPNYRHPVPEDCDTCRNCGRDFPGPPLQVIRIGDPPAFRMRIGQIGRHYQFRAHELTRDINPVDLVQRRLERMEAELLFAYAQANFHRPDVAEWVQAYTDNLIGTPASTTHRSRP
jgi:hypothetical protein